MLVPPEGNARLFAKAGIFVSARRRCKVGFTCRFGAEMKAVRVSDERLLRGRESAHILISVCRIQEPEFQDPVLRTAPPPVYLRD